MMLMKRYTNRFVQSWIGLLIMIGTFVVACSVPLLYNGYLSSIALAGLIGISLAVSFTLGYYAVKRFAVREQTVLLAADAITIQAGQTGEQRIPLNEIASYFYQEFQGNKVFRLRLHSGRKVLIKHNDTFCAADDIQALAVDFEQLHTTATSSTKSSLTEGISREKTFFEKPIGNIIGWLILTALVLFSGYLLINGVNIKKLGAVLMFYGNGLVYLGGWLNTRHNRPKA